MGSGSHVASGNLVLKSPTHSARTVGLSVDLLQCVNLENLSMGYSAQMQCWYSCSEYQRIYNDIRITILMSREPC